MVKYKIFNPNNKKHLHVDNDGQCSWSDLKRASSMTLVGKADLIWARKQVGIMLDDRVLADGLEFIESKAIR